MPTQEELVEIIINSLTQLNPDDSATDKLAFYCYIPHKKLPECLEKFKQHLQISQPTPKQLQERGKFLAPIVYLVFLGLKGATSFQSFQSARPQYDLLVSGDNEKWMTICKLLYLKENRRDIIIEAKAKQSKLADKDFARLCSIMDLQLANSGLGIFCTLEGATGFPERNSTTRQRTIGDCRLRQVLYHANTNQYIIVLNKEDIFSLDKPGSLITLLTRNIRDISEMSGLPPVSVEKLKEVDLPQHLKDFDT